MELDKVIAVLSLKEVLREILVLIRKHLVLNHLVEIFQDPLEMISLEWDLLDQ